MILSKNDWYLHFITKLCKIFDADNYLVLSAWFTDTFVVLISFHRAT